MNEQCPRCGSFKTQKLSKIATFFVLLGTGSCLLWVGFIFWPLWIFSGLFIIASPLGFLVPKMTTCKECKYSWKTGEAEKYKKAVDEIAEMTKPKTILTKKNDSVVFRVAGVTKENEEGKDIQRLLKRIANEYKKDGEIESFEGYTNSEIVELGYDVAEFTDQLLVDVIKLIPEPNNQYDKNAIKVYLKDIDGKQHHVGYVKREDNIKLLNELKINKIRRTTAEFIGGRIKRVDYNYEYNKDWVVTDEITRGLSIQITFDNELQSS